jgi:hypothetical protein
MLGYWNEDDVHKFGIKDYIAECGIDAVEDPNDRNETLWGALSRVYVRDWSCERKVKGKDGDMFRNSVSAMLFAKLVPRAILCLLFPSGAFITAFVGYTAQYPLFCADAPTLNKLLPRLIVFESRLLAEERVNQMHCYAEWKVDMISAYIFVIESRLFNWLYGVLQYFLSLSILFFPSYPFLAAGVFVIFVRSFIWTFPIWVALANVASVKDKPEPKDESADAATSASGGVQMATLPANGTPRQLNRASGEYAIVPGDLEAGAGMTGGEPGSAGEAPSDPPRPPSRR